MMMFTTLQAEDGRCGGAIVRCAGSACNTYADVPMLASEASGRAACTLRPGETLTLNASAAFNAIAVRYSVPDAAGGGGRSATLAAAAFSGDVQKFSGQLQLSSNYSWFYGQYPFTNTPEDGLAHHFYDEVRAVLPAALGAGSLITLTVPPARATANNCSATPFPRRVDCGFSGVTPAHCVAKGCCYDAHPMPNPQHRPYWCALGHRSCPSSCCVLVLLLLLLTRVATASTR